MMKKFAWWIVGMLGYTLWVSAAFPQDVERGERLFQQHCAVCHGLEGRGDGPAAFVLYPKPRDLTQGTFKIRSTPTVPTDDDLFRTITRGIPGTSMPGWSHLSEADRWALVDYVKKLAGLLGRPSPKPVVIPKPPPRTPELLALGKRLYTELGCFNCHGPEGKGDGPAAATLKDEWGHPSVPYDFTIPGRMKGGASLEDIYRTLWVGMGGTPMPSYAGVLDPQKTWALAYYVLSLAQQVPVTPPKETGTIVARYVTEALPRDPMAPFWRPLPAVRILLRPLWLRKQFVEELIVRAAHNGREVAFLLEWKDPVRNLHMLRHQDFRDAVAVQFSLNPGDPAQATSFVMGDPNRPVNIWHWKADWETDQRYFADVPDVYLHMAWDWYPFQNVVPVGSRADRPPTAPVTAFEPLYLPGWKAGNLFSTPNRRSSVEDLNAAGVGTVTAQPPEDQDVWGRGVWVDGRWRVVMIRRLQTRGPHDVQFQPGQPVPVAFAVWDGEAGDRDGQKSVSVWYTLLLTPKR